MCGDLQWLAGSTQYPQHGRGMCSWQYVVRVFAHGTLPTSSTEPHLANHPSVGSALVSKCQVINMLKKQQEPGALPAPTEAQLQARRQEPSETPSEMVSEISNEMVSEISNEMVSEISSETLSERETPQ